MRTMTTMILMLAVSFAGAQSSTPPHGRNEPAKPAPKKSALEDALDLALKNNPDLRVAASKLALAEAELSKTRLQVTQKVAAAYADVEVARATLKEVERQVARFRTLHERGAITGEEVSKAELQLVEAKAKLAAAERELTHLQGKGGIDAKLILGRIVKITDYDTQGRLDLAAINLGWDAGVKFYRGAGQEFRIPFIDSAAIPFIDSAAKTTGSDKLRQALQKPVTLSGQKMTLSDYLALVRKTGEVGIQADLKDPAWKEPVDFDFKDVTVGGMLQFLEDSLPNHRIVVRHYGLLIATREKVPEGAVTLTAFLHAGVEKANPKATEPRETLEGKILKVDGKFCTISLGKNAGLTKGQRLHVYRPAPMPKYLGLLEVGQLSDNEAVCKTGERMAGNIAVGDGVTTRVVQPAEVPIGPPAR